MPIPAGSTTLPDWTPALWDVADRLPGRTLVVGVDGSNVEVATFSAATRPTDTQVARLVAAAVAWVTVRCGVLDPSLYEMGTATAATYTAGCVERGYPDRQHTNRDDAITTATDLFKQAADMREDLHAANEALTGQDPEDVGPFEIVPVYSFPAGVNDCFI